MRLKKVKVTSENKIMMIYEVKNKRGTWDEYQFSCSDDARPEFYEALKALRTHVITMCELPTDYLSRIEVRGVSVSYGGDREVMGATISARMTLHNSNCDLNLNTPHKASDPYSDGGCDEKQLLDEDCVRDLHRLYEECKLYINGERAQGKLFAVS